MLNDNDFQNADELFEKVFKPHFEALSRFAYRLAQDEQDAEDLVQNTYLNAYRFSDKFEQGTNAKAWLFSILRNVFLSDYRKKKNIPRHVDYEEVFTLEELGTGIVPLFSDLRSELFDDLIGDEVTQAINELPVNFRLVLLLCDVEGFSYSEISRITNAPIGTVRSRLHRSRNMLQDRLRSYAKSKGIKDKKAK